MVIYIFLLAVVSGVLGRMGGVGKPFDTLYRDVGCSLVAVASLILLFGFDVSKWYAYVLIFGLHWAALSTYWDDFFGGKDNLAFSGFAVGLSFLPAVFIFGWISLWIIIGRAFILAGIWGSLNKFLPERVLAWRRDVAEEFLRYFVLL